MCLSTLRNPKSRKYNKNTCFFDCFLFPAGASGPPLEHPNARNLIKTFGFLMFLVKPTGHRFGPPVPVFLCFSMPRNSKSRKCNKKPSVFDDWPFPAGACGAPRCQKYNTKQLFSDALVEPTKACTPEKFPDPASFSSSVQLR